MAKVTLCYVYKRANQKLNDILNYSMHKIISWSAKTLQDATVRIQFETDF